MSKPRKPIKRAALPLIPAPHKPAETPAAPKKSGADADAAKPTCHFECKYDAGDRIKALEKRMSIVEKRVQTVEVALNRVMDTLAAQGIVQEDIRDIVKHSQARMQEVVTALNVNSSALSQFIGAGGESADASQKPLTVQDMANWRVQVLAKLSKWGIIAVMLPEIIHQIVLLLDTVSKLTK